MITYSQVVEKREHFVKGFISRDEWMFFLMDAHAYAFEGCYNYQDATEAVRCGKLLHGVEEELMLIK